ncbi:MAG: hypothetical protein ACD_35C00018G0001 [uncultured bacterium]|nr:MAG: hypothetical protein ACD_35C00018G0001 [uncultured bacterium]
MQQTRFHEFDLFGFMFTRFNLPNPCLDILGFGHNDRFKDHPRLDLFSGFD